MISFRSRERLRSLRVLAIVAILMIKVTAYTLAQTSVPALAEVTVKPTQIIMEWRNVNNLPPLPAVELSESGIYLPVHTIKTNIQPGRGPLGGDFYLGMVTVLSDTEESLLPEHVLESVRNHYAFRMKKTPYQGYESFFVLAYGEIFGKVAIPKVSNGGTALLIVLRFSPEQHIFYRSFELQNPSDDYIAAPLTGGLYYLCIEILADGTFIVGEAGAAG
jgi:hypothetical protein